ncbi:hypothetical protein FACS189485_09640 [Spirochaetia bacterium]|nr:hypothetical protein FACS189485_09640 [Spirochaetia bacterium]
MNVEMAYLLGLICGNGTIKRGNSSTLVSIDIPHKKLETEDFHDVKLYVKASITDIRKILEPLIGTSFGFIQKDTVTVLSFEKQNNEYVMREILRFIGNASSHDNIRLNIEIFNFKKEEKIYFLRGFSDVTGYIRRSNYYFYKYKHRVYIEIPHNWELVIDIANLLKLVDIPIQTIDWAHPNMRDGNLRKYNQGNTAFWKKEHQIKIWVNEFLPIGFGILHKQQALEAYNKEFLAGFTIDGIDPKNYTHHFYWEKASKTKAAKAIHPSEKDAFIPNKIRGVHYDSWKDIARDLGYEK